MPGSAKECFTNVIELTEDTIKPAAQLTRATSKLKTEATIAFT